MGTILEPDRPQIETYKPKTAYKMPARAKMLHAPASFFQLFLLFINNKT